MYANTSVLCTQVSVTWYMLFFFFRFFGSSHTWNIHNSGFTNNKSGYDSFVEAATGLWSNFNPVQQHEIVAKTLDKAIPRPILAMASSSFSSHRLLILTYVENAQVYRIQVMMPWPLQIRTLLPDSKFTRELFAVFTTLCFAWLIGPNEVRLYLRFQFFLFWNSVTHGMHSNFTRNYEKQNASPRTVAFVDCTTEQVEGTHRRGWKWPTNTTCIHHSTKVFTHSKNEFLTQKTILMLWMYPKRD